MFDPALETLPLASVRAHQWRRFTAMARELDANPFYRAKWQAAGVRAADDVRGWDDFARLPFTRKAEFVEDQAAHGEPGVTTLQYMATSRFWFESFQNWQSEFLSIAAMVVGTIFLRQRGSAESKSVHAAHAETGKG